MSQTRYRTTNWKQYDAALKARGSLTVWLDKRMCWFAAIQFCLTLKNLFGLALRQATELVESVLQLSGLSWPTPDFSTLSRRQQTLNVQIPYTRSQAGLHLLVDSRGIKFLGEGEWKCKKHGAEYRSQWRKLRIGIDAKTLQIRVICVTSDNVSDAAVIPDLLDQLPQDEKLESLTGDGAYDTKQVYEAVIEHGGTPIIPPRKMHEYAKAKPLYIAMQRLPRANGWAGGYGKSGVVTTDEVWWKPK